MLKFEKEILKTCTNKNHLLILAEGLGILEIIRTELMLYDYDYTLTILLNFFEEEIEFLSRKIKLKNFASILSQDRNKAYKQGGIFSVSQRMFITDLLNENIEIKKISAVFINKTEKLTRMSTECFIVQLIRKTNKDCVIKCYSEKPYYFSNSLIFLDEMFQSLKIDTLILFPRFHEYVKESLLSLYINEHKLTLNKEIKELQVYLMDIIQSVTNQFNILTRKEKKENKEISTDLLLNDNLIYSSDTVKGKQLISDIINIRRLVFLLFSVDIELFYEEYIRLFQIQVESEGTWINNLSSHLLKEKLEEMISKKREEDERELETKRMKNEEENKFFYNSKLKKLISLIKEYKNKRICVLSKSSEIVELICKHLNESCKGFSHREFKLVDEKFDNYILLDPSLSSLRKLEVIYSMNQEITIDTLCFKESLEEQKSLLDIREERDSFLTLIDRRSKQGLFFTEEEEKLGLNVIIDVREMRSTLPFAMYKHGMNLDVCTLSVGDYFINSICVERKEINDLIGSINSGRLYNQVNQLTNLFDSPILLIEFSGRMSLSDYLKKGQLNKFIILLINFPKLKLLWSNNDNLTIKCLTGLENKKESKRMEYKIDPELMEILLSIDGVDHYNVYKIINNFTNLKELSLAEENKLISLVGEMNGKRIFNFFRNKFDN